MSRMIKSRDHILRRGSMLSQPGGEHHPHARGGANIKACGIYLEAFSITREDMIEGISEGAHDSTGGMGKGKR